MLKRLKGIVVKEVDYQESSKIINVFTEGDGIVGILAKGCRKLKSPFTGACHKLVYGEFQVNYKSGLSTLVEADCINNFKNIKKDIIKISYASFLMELCTQVYTHEQKDEILLLLLSSLTKIDEMYDEAVICNIVELKLLDYLGIRPMIDHCYKCGEANNIVTISSYRGGYVCKNCHTNEEIVSSKTIKMLRMLYYVDIDSISKIDISANVKKEINMFIDDYYDRYAGLYLKSKSFLKKMVNDI